MLRRTTIFQIFKILVIAFSNVDLAQNESPIILFIIVDDLHPKPGVMATMFS